jgi:TPR repeat protein
VHDTEPPSARSDAADRDGRGNGRGWQRVVAALAVVAACGAGAAQDAVNVGDLKARAAAGEKAATRELADMYYTGRGVKQDYREAARWYEKLAKLGDARAQTSLGLMYARGYGVKQDLRKAHRYWSFAAAQNDPGAQFNLGLSYSRGDGVPQDYERAAEWYRMAASRGHVQAQHNLGMLYHLGRGVDRDPARAYFWIRVAALQGDELAREFAPTLAANLTAAQLEQADSQANAWMAKARRLQR